MSAPPADLLALVGRAREQGASDLHLEPGLPPGLRVRGTLRLEGEVLTAPALQAMARALLTPPRWATFLERQSFDMSRTLCGVRCRINVLRTARGVGMAVRLLASFQASLQALNLHPSLAGLMARTHGLVIVSGPTGAGKSSTLAAMVQEVNLHEARHIITVESPIEYALVPHRSLIRQREVGRDTPSFSQALIDALREDPDVLLVGEMRDPETMRLTLGAAETGHLVLATMHSATATEALQRLVSAFAPEAQASICAQLADALVAVVCQRLAYRPALGICLPELEIMMATLPVRSILRQGAFSKLQTALETGGADGNYTFARYRDWLDRRTDFHVPGPGGPEPPPDDFDPQLDPGPWPGESMGDAPTYASPADATPGASPSAGASPPFPEAGPPDAAAPAPAPGVLVIDEHAGDPAAILAELERTRGR